jgi:hypothetical protein
MLQRIDIKKIKLQAYVACTNLFIRHAEYQAFKTLYLGQKIFSKKLIHLAKKA